MNSPNPNTTWFSEKKIVGSQPKFDTQKKSQMEIKFDEGIGWALTAVVSFANIISYNNEKKGWFVSYYLLLYRKIDFLDIVIL